jgi:hypothetical protein
MQFLFTDHVKERKIESFRLKVSFQFLPATRPPWIIYQLFGLSELDNFILGRTYDTKMNSDEIWAILLKDMATLHWREVQRLRNEVKWERRSLMF